MRALDRPHWSSAEPRFFLGLEQRYFYGGSEDRSPSFSGFLWASSPNKAMSSWGRFKVRLGFNV